MLRKARLRLALSRAKHRSLAGHARLARRMAALMPYYEYDQARFFSADDAPAGGRRQRGAPAFKQLAALYAERFREERWR